MAFFERAAVVGPDLAEITGGELGGNERGDDVVLIQTTKTRYQLHLRRGMDESDIAAGLRRMADAIEEDAPE